LDEQDEQALLKGTRQAERAQIDDCECGREQQGIHLDAERGAASKGGGRGEVSRVVVLHRFCWLRLDGAHEVEQDGASRAQGGKQARGRGMKDSKATPARMVCTTHLKSMLPALHLRRSTALNAA
jgi:hypothetical protein